MSEISKNISITPRQYTTSELEVIARRLSQTQFLNTRNENEVFALLMIAQNDGINIVQACMDYHIIKNKPSLSSQAILTRFQRAGGIIKYLTRTDECCEIEFKHPQAGEITVKWTMETAKKAELNIYKDNWKKYPRQMLNARCIAEGVRALYPACLNNLYASEEVEDFSDNVIDIENNNIENQNTIQDNTINISAEVSEDLDLNNIDTLIIKEKKSKNYGKKWYELDFKEIDNAIKFYKDKGKMSEKNINTLIWLSTLIVEYQSPINKNACKGDTVLCILDNALKVIKIVEDEYVNDNGNIIHYFILDNGEKILAREVYNSEMSRISSTCLHHTNREERLREKYTKRKIAEGKLDKPENKYTKDFGNVVESGDGHTTTDTVKITVNGEDDDPFTDDNIDFDDLINEQEKKEKTPANQIAEDEIPFA